jgi:hypothetical protein
VARGKLGGRPKLEADKQRSRLISVRVTGAEYKKLEKCARAKRGRTLSKWVRLVIFDAADQWEIGRDPY